MGTVLFGLQAFTCINPLHFETWPDAHKNVTSVSKWIQITRERPNKALQQIQMDVQSLVNFREASNRRSDQRFKKTLWPNFRKFKEARGMKATAAKCGD